MEHLCDRCQEAPATVRAYDSDESYCQKCADYLEAMWEAQWESTRDELADNEMAYA